jgi:RNA polymerase sigma-70 factor (ECF subfamily)
MGVRTVSAQEARSSSGAVEPSDQALLEACVRGDSLGWDTLYRRYYQHVRRIVAWPRWHFSPAEVEDCTQEVFFELIRALPNFRGDASLSTFLTRLAKNKCISTIRRKTAQKRGREELGYVLEERKGSEDERVAIAVDKAPLPEEQLIAQDDAVEVIRALERLNTDCQTILRLRYFNDMAYDEICKQLNLPLGTVCSRLKRCLERLKKLVEP